MVMLEGLGLSVWCTGVVEPGSRSVISADVTVTSACLYVPCGMAVLPSGSIMSARWLSSIFVGVFSTVTCVPSVLTRTTELIFASKERTPFTGLSPTDRMAFDIVVGLLGMELLDPQPRKLTTAAEKRLARITVTVFFFISVLTLFEIDTARAIDVGGGHLEDCCIGDTLYRQGSKARNHNYASRFPYVRVTCSAVCSLRFVDLSPICHLIIFAEKPAD